MDADMVLTCRIVSIIMGCDAADLYDDYRAYREVMDNG